MMEKAREAGLALERESWEKLRAEADPLAPQHDAPPGVVPAVLRDAQANSDTRVPGPSPRTRSSTRRSELVSVSWSILVSADGQTHAGAALSAPQSAASRRLTTVG